MLTVQIGGQKAVIARLDKALEAVGNVKKPLEETGDLLIREFKENFPQEGGRLNAKWKELAASTVREKQRLGYGNKGILERTGRLKNAFEKAVTQFSVRVSNPTPYFRYHQLGEGYNPRRVMIKRTDAVSGEIFEILNKFIRSSLSK